MDDIEKRVQFEAWAGDQGFILDRTDIGGDYDYQDLRTQGPWEAWQAALSAAPQVPDGWVLVPLELTDDMAIAFAEVWFTKRRPIDDPEMEDSYAAMLAAKPEPQA